MPNPMTKEAARALVESGWPTKNNQCQKWARMVVQAVVGHKYDKWLWKGEADEAGMALLAGGFAFRASELEKHGGLQEGDLLYKTVGSGGAGHVGIYLGSSKVAENSTTHWLRSGKKDARGIRTLKEFGAFQIVARFPLPNVSQPMPVPKVEPKPEPAKSTPQQSIIIVTKNGDRMSRVATVKNGPDNWAKVRDILEAAGLEIERLGEWSDGSPALFLKP